MGNSLTQHIFFFSLFIGVWYVLYLVAQPFLVPLFLAVVFAVMFHDIHRRIAARFGRNGGAFVSTLLVLITVVIPVLFVGFLIFNEARDMYIALSADVSSSYFDSTTAQLNSFLQNYLPGTEVNFKEYFQNIVGWIVSNTGSIFTSLVKILIDIFIMIIALFFMFRDGGTLKEYIIHISPFDRGVDEDIISKLTLTIRALLRGVLIIAVAQGTLAAIGFTIFGIGNPVIWGTTAAVASLIPGIGVGLVNLPASIYLLVTGQYLAGIGFILWSIFITGMIDNILNPLLLERQVKVHSLLILISVLGGLTFFGPIGFLAGPITLVLGIELLKLYPRFARQQHVPIYTQHTQ